MYGTMPARLKTEIPGAVDKIVIPALNAQQTEPGADRHARSSTASTPAIFLTVVSPEFQVQTLSGKRTIMIMHNVSRRLFLRQAGALSAAGAAPQHRSR